MAIHWRSSCLFPHHTLRTSGANTSPQGRKRMLIEMSLVDRDNAGELQISERDHGHSRTRSSKMGKGCDRAEKAVR